MWSVGRPRGAAASFLAVLRQPWPPASSTSPVARRHPPRPACYRRRFPSAAHRSARPLDPRRRMPRLPYPKRRHPPAPHASPRACPSSTFRRTTRAPRRHHRVGAVRRGSTPSRGPTTPSCTTACFRPGSCSIPPWRIPCGITTGTAGGPRSPRTPRPTRSETGTSARRALPGTSYWFGMVRFCGCFYIYRPSPSTPNLICCAIPPANGCAQYLGTLMGGEYICKSPDPTT